MPCGHPWEAPISAGSFCMRNAECRSEWVVLGVEIVLAFFWFVIHVANQSRVRPDTAKKAIFIEFLEWPN